MDHAPDRPADGPAAAAADAAAVAADTVDPVDPWTAYEPRHPVSEELFAPVAADVELCYQTFGDPAGEPLLLVMGLGGPMTWWNPELCDLLVDRGFFVVRFDNRDTGRSSRLRHRVSRLALVRAFLGQRVRPPYTLSDLAADGVGLLDHLGLGSAHVAGVSMGGMVAQTMALEHPSRVRSLTSIMSTTGRRTAGFQHPRLLPGLLATRGVGREAYVASSVAFWRLIGSPGYQEQEERIRRRAEETWDRGFSAGGVMRQMMAVLTQPNREAALRDLRVPTTVVHGMVDPMVHVSGGRATARAVPGAELVLVAGMAHDMPQALYPTLADAVARSAERARRQGGDGGGTRGPHRARRNSVD